MCRPPALPPPAASSASPMRKVCFALASFCVGAWAFHEVNEISGPAFEPILAACQNPDISTEDFAEKTGYHAYEPKLGLGAFNVLVCLITQFLLELRQTPPAGLLVWGGVVVVSLPLNLLSILVAGRGGARGPVRYPTIFGLLYQLLGVSVIFPLLYVPSYIYSNVKFGVPATNARIYTATLMALPVSALTGLVFLAPTDSYMWTCAAGILGGPLLAMMALTLWFDKSSTMEGTAKNVARSAAAIQRGYSLLAAVGVAFHWALAAVAYQTYGFSFGLLWRDIWVEAGASVSFMTVDTGVLFLGVLLLLAYESERKAAKALALTPVLGPGAACCMMLKELESEATSAFLNGEKKNI